MLAKARVLLGMSCLIAVVLDPTQPSRYAPLAYLLIGVYLTGALVTAAIIHGKQALPASVPVWLQGLDAIFAVVITLLTDGPSGPFFVFFFWVLLSAAFRWGFLETLLTGVACFAMILAELGFVYYLGHERWGLPREPHFEVNLVIIRGSYLILVAILLGYLSENEKQSRAESGVIAGLLASIRPERGLRGALESVLDGLFTLFRPAYAVVLIDESDTGRSFVWRAARDHRGEMDLRLSEVDPHDRAFCVPLLISTTHLVRRNGSGWDALALEQDGRRAHHRIAKPAEFGPEFERARSLLVVPFTFAQEWSGKLMLFDVVVGPSRHAEIRFAQKLVSQIGPAVYSVYLLRRLRRRAGAIERTRVARELHDGAIQSIISLEMQVDVLRRKAAASASPLVADLERIESVLHREVLDLRELMQQMKPVEVGPQQLLDFLAEAVERFRRDTGIRADFVSELDEVTLPPRIARELVRITQEALVNIRKHSGAATVLVRFTSQGGHWKLIINDDGRGFDFVGRLSQRDLDAARKGPSIIKERVRGIGGELAIESHPGSGSRLEITVPQKSQAAHG